MALIFINYRRDDANLFSQQLYTKLTMEMGNKKVFKDIPDIPIGKNYKEVVEKAIESCRIMLVVIGKQWLEEKDEYGSPRLHSPKDPVCFEISKALREKKRVIPVLLDGVKMPAKKNLPEEIKTLANLHASEIRADSMENDIDRLINDLRNIILESKHQLIKTILKFKYILYGVLLIPIVIAGILTQYVNFENMLTYIAKILEIRDSTANNKNYWIGDWTHSETWKNGVTSEGVMTLENPGESNELEQNFIIGESYNINAEKSILEGKVTDKGGIFQGKWRNTATNGSGTFVFKRLNTDSFSGYYTYGDSTIENKWNGQKFKSEKFYTHIIDIKVPSVDQINIRNCFIKKKQLVRIHRDKNFRESIDKDTIIGQLVEGTKVKILDDKEAYKEGWFKIVTKIKNRLIMGFISTTYGTKTTPREEKLTVKPLFPTPSPR